MANSYVGKKGQKCPVCESRKIKNYFAHTCGEPDCVKQYKNSDRVESETRTQSDSVWDISLPKTRIHTLAALIEYCEVDLQIWEVVEFVTNKWEVAGIPRATRSDGEEKWVRPTSKMKGEQLFQVKARFKKKKNVEAAIREIQALKELAKTVGKKQRPAVSQPVSNGGKMLEINMPDLHVGKLAWSKETGWENYDAKIAQAIYWEAFDKLLSRASSHQYDEVLLIVGNDLLNSDDTENRTTRGTTVTTDGRYHKTFGIVRTMMIESIERLREQFKTIVRVLMVSGNHDVLSVWHLGDSLECYFHGVDDVIIDNTPRARKYHNFGKVMLMFTHGDKASRDDYPLLMATEQAEMFGKTLFREAHTGHNHKTKLDEKHGVRVRVLPALCAEDDWHSEQGFVGNLRSAEAYIWDAQEGLIATVFASRAPRPGRVVNVENSKEKK